MGEASTASHPVYMDPTDILSGFQMGRLRCVEGEVQSCRTETTQMTHDVTRGSRAQKTPKRKPREELTRGAAELTGKKKLTEFSRVLENLPSVLSTTRRGQKCREAGLAHSCTKACWFPHENLQKPSHTFVKNRCTLLQCWICVSWYPI